MQKTLHPIYPKTVIDGSVTWLKHKYPDLNHILNQTPDQAPCELCPEIILCSDENTRYCPKLSAWSIKLNEAKPWSIANQKKESF